MALTQIVNPSSAYASWTAVLRPATAAEADRWGSWCQDMHAEGARRRLHRLRHRRHPRERDPRQRILRSLVASREFADPAVGTTEPERHHPPLTPGRALRTVCHWRIDARPFRVMSVGVAGLFGKYGGRNVGVLGRHVLEAFPHDGSVDEVGLEERGDEGAVLFASGAQFRHAQVCRVKGRARCTASR